jgi:hypothetical protein
MMAHVSVQEPAPSQGSSKGAMARGLSVGSKTFDSAVEVVIQLPSRLFDIINIELKPCLWDENAVRPSFFAETRLSGLRKRPQG